MRSKIALISRSTLYSVPGGDTVQMENTCRELNKLGFDASIALATEELNTEAFDLLHFFNITRPWDIIPLMKTKPYVLTPIYVDYSEYDLQHRKGLDGLALRVFGKWRSENLKYFARKIRGNEQTAGMQALFTDYRQCLAEILNGARCVFPASQSEADRLTRDLQFTAEQKIVHNGIDVEFWSKYLVENSNVRKDVLCAARIEGVKNQLTLIRAMEGVNGSLTLIGNPAPNQKKYYKECISIAGKNVQFLPHRSQAELAELLNSTRVHVLPSWFETTGLSSLEAAFMGCNVVISDRGDVKEYFGNYATYADPASADSIRNAITSALKKEYDPAFREEIRNRFTWQRAAQEIGKVYKEILTD